MKSYTDLAQSQILAKILPFTSADMKWFVPADNEGEFIEEVTLIKYKSEYNLFEKVTDWNDTPYVPCWSLSALLNFLPRPDLHQTKGGQWYCVTEPNRMYFSKHFDNPIDACVDMIVKLTEEVEPVPLNSKILEKNGIELSDNRPQHYDLAKYFKSKE